MTTNRIAMTAACLGLLIAGCDVVVPGSVREVDPKLVAEARAASPECKSSASMEKNKDSYAPEDLAAAKACTDASIRYLRAKYKGKY